MRGKMLIVPQLGNLEDTNALGVCIARHASNPGAVIDTRYRCEVILRLARKIVKGR